MKGVFFALTANAEGMGNSIIYARNVEMTFTMKYIIKTIN